MYIDHLRCSQQQLLQKTRLGSSKYSRYNMTFRPNQAHLSMIDTKLQKINKPLNLLRSSSYENQNKFIFTKYSYFPAHINKNRDLKASIQITKKNQEVLKLTEVKQVEKTNFQKSFIQRNAFPQRKTKCSDQLIINMLLKYDRHYGRLNQEDLFSQIKPINNVQSQTPRYYTNQKKIKNRTKWFKDLQIQKTSK